MKVSVPIQRNHFSIHLQSSCPHHQCLLRHLNRLMAPTAKNNSAIAQATIRIIVLALGTGPATAKVDF